MKGKVRLAIGCLLLTVALLAPMGFGCAKPAPVPAPAPAPAPAPKPTPAPAPAPKYTWKLACSFAPGSTMALPGDVFAELVEQRTDGLVKVECFHGGALGSIIEVMEAMSADQLGMGIIWGYGSLHPGLDLQSIPFAATNYDEVDALFYDDGIIKQTVDRIYEQIDIIPIIDMESGFQNLWNSKRPVRTPADMKGLKLRAIPGALWIEIYDRLDAIAAPIAWGEVYDALRTGAIDGVFGTPISGYEYKFHEGTKYVTDINVAYGPAGYGMSLALWNRLPADIQKVVIDSGKVAENYCNSMRRRQTADTYALLADYGLTVTHLTLQERQAFVDKLKPEEVWDEVLAPVVDDAFPGENIIQQIKAEVAQLR